MDKKHVYKVAVRCSTYNHARFIEDALHGFSIQRTDFPVVYLIVDDASTDGEQDILRTWAKNNLQLNDCDNCHKSLPYGELICANHNRQKNAFYVLLLLSENHTQSGKGALKLSYLNEWHNNSEYLAICEGDDYWFHPLKLQRQIFFLDNHPDYTMCFHNAFISYEDSTKPAQIFNNINEDREVSMSELIAEWLNPTASIVYRISVEPLFPVKKKIISGDWRRTLHCAACGKIWAMKDVMSCYRITYGTSSITSQFSEKSYLMYKQQITILEGLDDFTKGKYHNVITQYCQYYGRMAKFLQIRNEKGIMWARFRMPAFYLKKLMEK